MTVREFKKMVAEIDAADDDCEVLMPMDSPMPGMFAFEGVCPGVSGMIELGACPEWLIANDANNGKPMRALLIAPHSFHDDDDQQAHKAKEILN